MSKCMKFLTFVLILALCMTGASALAATEVSDAAAFKAAVEAGDSVVLAGDITLTELLKIQGKTLSIDLNGHTLFMPKGDNQIIGGADVTISGGTVDISNGVANGNAYINIGSDSTTCKLTLKDMTFTGTDYSSAFGVFYIYEQSTLNIDHSNVILSGDKSSEGGVIKEKDGMTAFVNITNNSVLDFTNAKIGILGGTILLQDSQLNVTGGDNAINSNSSYVLHLTVDNSQVKLQNGTGGSGMKLRGGSTATVKNGSTFEISGFDTPGETDLVFDATGKLSIDDTSYVAYNTISSPADVLDSVIDADIVNLTEEDIADHVLAVAYTVTYTDGVADETIFADEVYQVYGGKQTPKFTGSTNRDGYNFDGWKPAMKEKVDGTITYEAIWTKDEPEVTPTPVAPTATPAPAAPAAPVAPTATPAPAPKTGDSTNLALWMGLMVISGMVLLGLGKKAKAGK